MAEIQYISFPLTQLRVNEPLPGPVYLYIDFRFITSRGQGDLLDATAYDRLLFKKMKSVFILEKDRQVFNDWWGGKETDFPPPTTPEQKAFATIREDLGRSALDIFQSDHANKMVKQTLQASKKLVSEIMHFPYAIKSLSVLQGYSRGTVDHSVNVSILASYLAMQMGYSHHLILQHVSMGALLHDIGKTLVPLEDGDSSEVIEKKMKEHPKLAEKFLESQQGVPMEVKMIIAQHHEYYDGTGYPQGLRGSAIYDLARVVTIANEFDQLFAKAKGSIPERQKYALKQIDEHAFRRFDPQKLDKSIRILKLGI